MSEVGCARNPMNDWSLNQAKTRDLSNKNTEI